MQSDKKFLTRLLPSFLCLMAMFLAACSGPSNAPTNTAKPAKAPLSQQIYRSPLTGRSDIQAFDPALVTDIDSINAIDMVFTGLVEMDDNLRVRAQLASTWDVSSDHLTYTFHLKPNLKFSDGTALTSKDVAYSIDRALQPATKSSISPTYLGLIKDSDQLLAGKIKTIIGDSIMTPDAQTIVIVLNQPAAYFLQALTYPNSYVVEQSLITKYGTNWTDHLTEGGGAGPFKVQEYTHGQRIVFVPNPNYYDPRPQLQQVIFPFYKEDATAYKEYQIGQIDTTSIPSANLDQARQLGREYHQVPELHTYYYTMNYLVKPFDNIHIRQAFALAINKDQMIHTVWKDQFIPTNHIVPQGMSGYNPNLTGPDGVKSNRGDPTKARQLLQLGLREEGWSSTAQLPPIVFTYPAGSTDVANEVAVVLQMWQTVLAVNVKPNAIDVNKLFDEITAATNNRQGLQFWRVDWIADYPDPQDWTSLQFGKGVSDNNMNYGQNHSSDVAQQQAVQQQLMQADVNPDQNARLQAYENAEQQLVNDVAWLPVEQVTNTFLLKPYVLGMVNNVQGLTPPDDWANIYIAQH